MLARSGFFVVGIVLPIQRKFSVNLQSLPDPTILRYVQSPRGALYEFLRVPAKSSFKRLLLRTAPWQAYTMSSTKSTESLKDSECEKGQLAIRPPISYVPPTDLHGSTESETIKVKLPDGTTVSVKAFSSELKYEPRRLGIRWASSRMSTSRSTGLP